MTIAIFVSICLVLAAIWQALGDDWWWALGLVVAACLIGPGGYQLGKGKRRQ